MELKSSSEEEKWQPFPQKRNHDIFETILLDILPRKLFIRENCHVLSEEMFFICSMVEMELEKSPVNYLEEQAYPQEQFLRFSQQIINFLINH